MFWLTVGAFLGVMGYRRLTALAHCVSPAARAAEFARFVADVREGRDLYMKQQGGRAAPIPGSRHGNGQLPGPPQGQARSASNHVKGGR